MCASCCTTSLDKIAHHTWPGPLRSFFHMSVAHGTHANVLHFFLSHKSKTSNWRNFFGIDINKLLFLAVASPPQFRGEQARGLHKDNARSFPSLRELVLGASARWERLETTDLWMEFDLPKFQKHRFLGGKRTTTTEYAAYCESESE